MLFKHEKFVGASGVELAFKIECDALRRSDWQCIADVSTRRLPAFGRAVGVPQGGLILAEMLHEYRDPKSRLVLIVDDVWTTGHSMNEFAEEYMRKTRWAKDWLGFVAFARMLTPIHVYQFARVMV